MLDYKVYPLADWQQQPNEYSCLPTAMSYVLGVDYDEVIKAFGHDGTQRVHPTMPSPFGLRAFTVMEAAVVAFNLKRIPILLQASCLIECGQSETGEPYISGSLDVDLKQIPFWSGVIGGFTLDNKPHAWAAFKSDEEVRLYDPSGRQEGPHEISWFLLMLHTFQQLPNPYVVNLYEDKL